MSHGAWLTGEDLESSLGWGSLRGKPGAGTPGQPLHTLCHTQGRVTREEAVPFKSRAIRHATIVSCLGSGEGGHSQPQTSSQACIPMKTEG